MILYLSLALLFIFLQGFFAGMETGMVSVLRPRAEHAAKQGSRSAELVVFFLHRPGMMIATALIGVNISVVMASLMTKKFIECFHFSGSASLFISSSVLSVVLLSCEIVPKNWFREAAFLRCSRFIYIFYGAYLLLYFPVRLFAAFTGFLSSLVARMHSEKASEPNVAMREDFRLFLRESCTYGSVDEGTASILDRAMDLPGMLIQKIMIPRNSVPEVSSSMSIREAFNFCRKHNVTKAPVCLDGKAEREWCGVFNIYDAIFSVDEEKWETTPVSSCSSRLYFIEENLRLGELMERLRFRRIAFFVVHDKDHKQCGIVRPEDLAALLFETDSKT